MADKLAADFGVKPLHMDAHGNAWAEVYSVTATAAINDKLYFGVIPAGTRVTNVRTINEATAASVTLDLGYEPWNPDGDPAADLDYWMAAADVAAVGTDQSTAFPILFDRPVQLVGTVKGAGYTAKRIDVVVEGICIGVR